MQININKYNFINFDKILAFPLVIMIVMAMFLPSDKNQGFFTPKSLVYIFAMLSMPFLIINKGRIKIKNLKIVLFLLVGLLLIFLSLSLSLGRHLTESNDAFSQTKLFIVTITTFSSIVIAIREKFFSLQTFLKIIIICNLIYCIAKTVLIIGHLLGFFNFYTVYKFFNLNVMTTGISNNLKRFQTSLDVLTPYLWLFYFRREDLKLKFSKIVSWIFVPITIFSIFLSFSRALWLVALASLFLSLIGKSRTTWIKMAACMILIGSIGAAFIGPENLINAIEHRFFSQEVRDSDNTRAIQSAAINKEIEYFPLIGKGVGSNAGDRDSFSYEVQWLSFLMQFGLVGIFFFLISFALIGWEYLKHPINSSRFAFLSGFILFLLGGFTNPFLLSLNSGIMYAAYLLPASTSFSKR